MTERFFAGSTSEPSVLHQPIPSATEWFYFRTLLQLACTGIVAVMSLVSGPPELTVFFDGSCPLCRREIALYRGLSTAQSIRWVDVSSPTAMPSGLTCELAMRRFHVLDTNDQLHSGAKAFSVLWRCFAGWRVLGWLTAVPPMSWLAEAAYRMFLPVRPRLQTWLRRRDIRSR